MRQSANAARSTTWVVDYSAARARAIEWLGDRYLLAKPINRRCPAGHRHPGQQRHSHSGDRD